jgi:hypothetical protein
MNQLKAIQTEYKGYRFRSRLEARWAVFFDACGVEWEYEPEGYDLGGGLQYLPDFLLHGVQGRDGGDLYVEVKGMMTSFDARKINRFSSIGMRECHQSGKSPTAILIVGSIPNGETMQEINQAISDAAYSDRKGYPNYYNFETIDGDYFAAHPGINWDGGFELFGDDSSYLCEMDSVATEAAFRKARQARFEFGETPYARREN